jgi:hypothetical protein
MGSCAVIYVPNFIKAGSGIQKLIGGIHTDTHGQQSDLISLLFFFQNKECGLKTNGPIDELAKQGSIIFHCQ